MAKATANKVVDVLKHADTRKNIPTEELRDFVANDEAAPPVMLYPRDPSLDPQLVWKGKDEQDREDLQVPVVPVYIQEKIQPQAIVDEVRKWAEESKADGVREDGAIWGRVADQTNLFDDFNGLPEEFDQRVDFYQHDGHWTNRMILGDSLLVMTSLAEKEGLKGKVQMVYIDPPYGIKFGSNWQVSTRKRDVKDGKAEDATRQPEQIRAFRDTWQLGIHSYLSYLRDRLVSTRELLTETGSCFVQIGDENVHLVRCLMDEVFGSENFISQIAFRTTAARGGDFLDSICNYIIWFGKNREITKFRRILVDRSVETESNYEWLDDIKSVRLLSERECWLPQDILNGKRFVLDNLTSQGYTETGSFSFEYLGNKYSPSSTRHWATTKEGMEKLSVATRLQAKGDNLFYRRYLNDYPVRVVPNNWEDTASGGFLKGDSKIYVVQTNSTVIERCLLMTTDPGDLVLDPTCGSGTAAYVAEQWGRRWITIDTSRVALALARTRLMTARYPYYYLSEDYPTWSQYGADDQALRKYLKSTDPAVTSAKHQADVRKGFVYRQVPHVTLKSIANNPDIREGMTRAEIDAAIARHADSETLYDQPFPDPKAVRVCGPFTVESLSPHRVLAAEDTNLDGHVSAQERVERGDFAVMILDNLKKAGVQNTIKGERLKFDTLESFAGAWIHAQGTYTDKEGQTRRVAISIGPEHGTVGPGQVKEAAKEAVMGLGFDALIVCGFAFDPHVSEEAKRYGKLQVLPARMNPDLSMGDELLKKTGVGNLFMIFGEPDIEVERLNGKTSMPGIPSKNGNGKNGKNGKSKSAQNAESKPTDDLICIKIKGVDIYDPTTGEIRSNSTDEIACWFIDTDYNGESFFVRHAYFTGAEEPYEKLKKALRAEINEEAWAALYSTESRPFPRPESGKIAVKVINHFGDEVLKVVEV